MNFFCRITVMAMLMAYASIVHAAVDYVPGEVLVQYKAGVTTAARSALRSHLRVNIKQHFSKFAVEHWRLPKGASVEAVVRQLQANPNIAFAEPNYRRYPHAISNDIGLGQQWGIQNIGQTIQSTDGAVVGTPGADMGLISAWNTTTGSKNVIVAVIDDSVDINHVDLYSNIWTNTGEIANNGIDDDGNGYIDDVHGWDFVNNDNDPSADTGLPTGSEEGHGTAVAGCIGAIGNNGIGVAGVNWQVQIMPLKFAGDVASELASIQYAINNGAHIVNASWGGPQFSQAESGGIQLLQNAGILLVTAAGNDDANNDLIADYPSGLMNPNILSVAASDYNDALSVFSHYGSTSVDIAAPGVDIYTTMSPTNSQFFGDSGITGLSYDYTSGTSFSSPYVAGIAALIKANNPAASFQEIKGRILAGATAQTGLQGFVSVAGTANAAAALTVPAQPVIVIRDVTWNDGGNGWPDPGETASFDIQLENVWLAATTISVTLTPLSANWSVQTAAATYPDLATDAYSNSVLPFVLSVAANATGYQVFKFRLDITAAGGYAVTRYYQIGLGNLQKASIANNTLMATAYDDTQLFHIDIPVNSTQVTITTTSGQDVDLLVNPQNPPQFTYQGYWQQGGVDTYTQVSASLTGNESITLPVLSSSGVFVTVLDATRFGAAATNYPYTLLVDYTPPSATAVVTIPGSTQTLQVVSSVGSIDSASVSTAVGVPAGVSIIDGLIAYTVRVPTVGASVTTTLTLSQAIPSNAIVYKVDNAGTYTIVPSTQWTIQANGSLALQLTDGGAFDLDGVANAVIIDPVAIAVPITPAITPTTPAISSKSGCSIGGNTLMDPTLPLLMLFSIIFALRRRIERRT